MKDRKNEIRTDEKTKHETLTGVCCQWWDCGSFDREVINLNGSASWKRQWVNTATEQQPPKRYASFYNDSPATIKLTDLIVTKKVEKNDKKHYNKRYCKL